MSETQVRRSTPKWGRLTIDLDPALHRDIKLAATREGMTLREYVTLAAKKQMEETALKAS